ncbi:MAG: flagellar protein FlgN [Burkholderiales bacterium]|nr:flagellar protein FlgN [Burkholderiales bacterium]
MAQGPDSGGLEAFLSALKRELLAFRQFHSLLQAEQDALVSGNTDSLIALAQQKNEKVIELTQLAEQRNRFLTDRVGSTNQIGMEAWLDSFDPADKQGVGKWWRELIELARNAKTLNQHNGQLIHTRLASNQQALAVLMSANATTSNLYGKDGQAYATPPTGSGRPLGKA